jgi:hypothetical protein
MNATTPGVWRVAPWGRCCAGPRAGTVIGVTAFPLAAQETDMQPTTITRTARCAPVPDVIDGVADDWTVLPPRGTAFGGTA